MASSNTIEIIIKSKDETSGALSGVQKALGGLGGIAKGALTVGLGAATAAVGGLVAGLGLSVSEAMEAQQNMAQLDAVLKSTGGAAGVTKEMALGLADALYQQSTFSDDAILSGENLLLTFTNIGKDVFPQATQAMVDMAAALGTDASSGAIQLGKALNDPVAGLSALQRVGVSFTADQEAMIKKMVETGDVAGAQKVILGELSKEFGGSAAAQAETFSGKLEVLKNNLLNVAENIGTSLLPVGQRLLDDFITPALPAIQAFGENLATAVGQLASGDVSGALTTLFGPDKAATIQSIVTAIGDFAAKISEIAGALSAGDLQGALSAIFPPEIVTTITTIVDKVTEFGGAVSDIVSKIQGGDLKGALESIFPQAVVDTLTTIADNVGPGITTMIEGIKSGLASANPLLESFRGLWEALGPFLKAAATVIGGVLVGALGILVGLFNGLAKAIEPLIKAIASVVDAITGVVTGIVKIFTGLFDVIIGLVTGNGDKVKQGFQTMGDGVKKIVDSLVQGVIGFFKNLWDAVVKLVSGFVEGVVKFFTDLYNKLVGHSIVSDIVNGIVKLFQDLVGKAGDIWNSIKTKIETIAGNIKASIDRFISGVQSAWTTFKTNLTNWWSQTWDTISSKVSGIVSSIRGSVDNIRSGIETAWTNLKNNLTNWWTQTWDNIKTTVSGVWAKIKSTLDTLINNILGLFKNVDWKQIGKGVLDGIKAGIQNGLSALLSFMTDIANQLIGKVKGALGIKSPSTEFEVIGRAITEGLIGGINEDLANQLAALQSQLKSAHAQLNQALKEQNADAIKAARQQLSDARAGVMDFLADFRSGWLAGLAELNMAGSLSNIASGFAGVFESSIEPLKREMEYWQEQVEAAKQAFSEDWGEPPSWQYLSELMQQLNAGMLDTTITSGDLFAAFQKLYEAYQPLINATSAYYAEQQKIAELQNQQKDLAFLQMQVDLLKLIKDNGLDAADILGGLTLGLEANAGDILQAMTAAMEAMIAQAQSDLGIASPSTVFYDIGAQMNAGLAQGIGESVAGPLTIWQALAQQLIGVWDNAWMMVVTRAQQAAAEIQNIFNQIAIAFGSLGNATAPGGNLLNVSPMQSGGPVYSGQFALAGESVFTRPEYFIPSTNGYVLTRQEAQAALARAVSGREGTYPPGAVYNLYVTTSRTTEPVLPSIQMMKAWSMR